MSQYSHCQGEPGAGGIGPLKHTKKNSARVFHFLNQLGSKEMTHVSNWMSLFQIHRSSIGHCLAYLLRLTVKHLYNIARPSKRISRMRLTLPLPSWENSYRPILFVRNVVYIYIHVRHIIVIQLNSNNSIYYYQ